MNQLAVKPAQVQPFLNAALEASNRLQAELATLTAQNAAQRGDAAAVLPALKQAAQLAPDNPIYQANLVLAQFADRPVRETPTPVAEAANNVEGPAVQSCTYASPLHPALLLAETHIAAQKGELEKACASAQAFLDQLKETTPLAESTAAAHYLTSRHALADQTGLPGKAFSALLLDLDLPAGAATCASLVLQVQPDDPELLALLAKAQAATGNLMDAVGSLELALCLSPWHAGPAPPTCRILRKPARLASRIKEYTCLLDEAVAGAPHA